MNNKVDAALCELLDNRKLLVIFLHVGIHGPVSEKDIAQSISISPNNLKGIIRTLRSFSILRAGLSPKHRLSAFGMEVYRALLDVQAILEKTVLSAVAPQAYTRPNAVRLWFGGEQVTTGGVPFFGATVMGDLTNRHSVAIFGKTNVQSELSPTFKDQLQGKMPETVIHYNREVA